VDDPFAGDERQHKSWRDLPPTPPLVWPTTAPAFATATAGVPALAAPAPSRRPRRRLVLGTALAVGALILVGTGVLAVGNQLNALQASLASAVDPSTPDKAAAAIPPSDEPLADTAAKLLPSVVQIEAGNAVGSGFVAAEGGLILTASHVVGRSDSVTLRLYDGTSVSGTVVAVDKSVDTAVIRAEESAAAGMKPLALGALAGVHVGDMTIAVGSPFGLSQTVTTGIVSALGRTVPTPVGELHDLIQTDAAINSGNSGGPLADREGKAIGINTAIASASGGSDGIGFAVPIDEALKILDKVKDGTWKAEDNAPADTEDPLGGLFDQFLGPNGLDGLRDLFGLGPDGSQTPGSQPPDGGSGVTPTPNGPLGGSDQADRMLRQLLDSLLQELQQQLGPGAQAPQPAPGPEVAPAPGGGQDPTADLFDGLMRQLLDELFQGLSPDGVPVPSAPDGPTGGQGA
jgi:putative serine protease PepD